MSEEYIVGEVLATFFENPQNFYKVLLIRVQESSVQLNSDEIVVTGIIGTIHDNSPYRFNGKVVSHPKYGQQFSVLSYQQHQPTGKKGLIAYFSSGRFPGIGEKTAEKIVDCLGENAIEQIIQDEDCLKNVPGLSTKKCESIRNIIIENQGTERILFELTNMGFTPLFSQKIMVLYKEKTMEIIKEDPYVLLQSIEGLGFRRIDAIAQQLEIAPDNLHRIKGAVYVVVRDLSYQEGHTYLIDKEVVLAAQKLLEQTRSFLIEPDQIVNALNELIREGIIISEENHLSLASLYYAEIGIVNAIQHRLELSKKSLYSKEDIEEAIQHVQKKFGIIYDDSQKQALIKIMQESLFILTGGPGTGKTTIINGVVEMYRYIEEIDLDSDAIQLAAPTGRAAKRMNELTGISASTIHRMLGISAEENSELEQDDYDESRSLYCEFLIIDEMSMVDTWLMNRLLRATPAKTKILFVGDKNQLPSVGPGQVLTDFLLSNQIPSIELTHIHRQKGSSSIVTLAHSIKDGHLPMDFTQNQPDRTFISCRSTQVLDVIEQIVVKAIKKGYQKKDIQVLAPMYKGEAGIHEINKMMQNILNPKIGNSVREIESFDRVFRVGDKVLQLVNVAEENIYNGDIGEITAIIFAKENEDQVDKIYVSFDHVEVEYKRNDFIQLTHAYCCSIHKAQGSEFQMVILPMVGQYQRMLQRNLLYTAVTRSKKFLIMCGQYEAFQEAANRQSARRQTCLKDLLQGNSFESLSIEEESSMETKLDHQIDKNPSEPLTLEKDTIDAVLTDSKEIMEVSTVQEVDETYQVTSESVLEKKTKSYVLTMALIESFSIDPMIGMEELTPYDFMTKS